MARARTDRGRLRQVENWLRANHPCDRPVVVRISTGVRPHAAETAREGRQYVIRLGRDAFRRWGADLAEVLIHEWAHARVWRTHRENDVENYHDDEWAIAYGKLYREFFDRGGDIDSCEFAPAPWK